MTQCAEGCSAVKTMLIPALFRNSVNAAFCLLGSDESAQIP